MAQAMQKTTSSTCHVTLTCAVLEQVVRIGGVAEVGLRRMNTGQRSCSVSITSFRACARDDVDVLQQRSITSWRRTRWPSLVSTVSPSTKSAP